jgi:Flp pilus assembly protein TadD
LAASASLLIADGDVEAALPALRFAINEEPTDTVCQMHLGQALTLTGDQAGARAAYRKAAELLPGDKSLIGYERARDGYKYMIDKGLKDLGPSEPPQKR